MSTEAVTAPAAVPLSGASGRTPALPLLISGAGLAVSLIGFFVATKTMAFAWLIAMVFWTSLAIGCLLFVMLQHVFDAGWGTVIRRQAEHWISSFYVLAIFFTPLLVLSLFKPDLIWKWMNGMNPIIAGDILYLKKEPYLNTAFFLIRSVGYFAIFTIVAYFLRRNSFAQDHDGDIKWTHKNRVTSAAGIILVGISLSFAAIDWMKSLDYHWFSTMYGVWYFATSMRVALAVLVLTCLVLLSKGYFQGILQKAHLHDIGKLMFAFTVFYAYVTFSQYFIIYNANIPEETYWYTIRELNPDGTPNQWKWVGFGLLFGYFLAPFLFLIFYKTKVTPSLARFAAIWILVGALIDISYNILPSKKVVNAEGQAINLAGEVTTNIYEWIPVPFLSTTWLWVFAAMAAIGGACVWMYVRSFQSTKLIPIRDPRILESINHHE
jgi:hypothetical protein